MANLKLMIIENDRNTQKDSDAQTIDFSSVRIGASNLEIKETTGAFDFSGVKLTNIIDGTGANDVVTKSQLDTAVAGAGSSLEWQASVSDFFDPSSALPAGPTTGDRYIASATGNGWTENYIYEYNGATWDETIPTTGTHVHVDAVPNSNYLYSGAAWAQKQYESTTASTGLTKVGVDIQIDSAAAGAGLAFSTGVFSVNAGNGIEIVSDNVQVAEDTTGGANLATAVNVSANGVAVKIDDNSIGENGSNQLEVKDAGITESKLSSSVAGTAIKGGAGTALSVDFAIAKTNDNASAITIRQIVYVKSNGAVDLAQATVSALPDSELGIVEDASIASAASGQIIFRRGAIVAGFTGLTPGAKVYVSRTTAGDYVQSLTGFQTGEFVYKVGRAISATEISFDPAFEYVY